MTDCRHGHWIFLAVLKSEVGITTLSHVTVGIFSGREGSEIETFALGCVRLQNMLLESF